MICESVFFWGVEERMKGESCTSVLQYIHIRSIQYICAGCNMLFQFHSFSHRDSKTKENF